MRKYETLLLLSPELSSEEMQAVLDTLKGVLDREGGSILAEDDWGMRELAYPVRKVMRGHYYRLEYAAPGASVQELERIIRITEGIFKFVTVQLDAEYEPTSEEAA